jgi:hypothetical protein
MAHPYNPGPRNFLLKIPGDVDHRIVAEDAQQAYEALRAFVDARGLRSCVIHDEMTGESLEFLVERSALARHTQGGAQTNYARTRYPNQYMAGAMGFFERGHKGLDLFGIWVPDLAEFDASPEEQGARHAARITTERGALAELGRIWADSGIVDPSDQFCIFFDAHGAEDDRVERTIVLKLLAFLGIEPVPTPAGSASGEVWIRRDSRLELEQWA